MIIIINEKYRKIAEDNFGSIIRYKRYVLQNNLQYFDYNAFLLVYDRYYVSLTYAYDQIKESIAQLTLSLSTAFKPMADALAEFTHLVYENCTTEDMFHPEEKHPKIVKSMPEHYNEPYISKNTNYRPRNNC